ncbi:MAG: sigma-70 family RNA polymerase sigma factor [Lachnospiraceae bacterium]|nr:sigma-70 family RNA polymerase sigma factor [Lachnospiraceae bacterium]
MEDQKIVELFFARSEDALTEVSVKYGGLIKKIAMNVLNNSADAEECANDTYMALWENIPPQRPQSMIGYICRLARNISVNRYRYNSAEKRNSSYEVALEEVDQFLSGQDSVEDALEARELTAVIEEFLKGLPKVDRVLFVSRYYFSESYRDIAEKTGLTEKNVSVRLTRIRAKLKDHLHKREIRI